MEKIANRLLLKTNTQYKLKNTDEYFFIQKDEKAAVICASDIQPYDWNYLYENSDNIEELWLIATSEDPDYYPGGYLEITSNNDYYIDDNDVLMIKDMFELEDSTIRNWINENSEDIEIFNQCVTIDADMCESMGIFQDIGETLFEECLENEHPDIVEFFGSDDSKILEWFKSVNQFPETVIIRNDGKIFIMNKDNEKKAEELYHLVYFFINKAMNKDNVNSGEIYQSILSVLTENE